jgi:hypothetical protein
VSGGGDLTAQGCGAPAAIDQHPGTVWSAPTTGSRTMTITLPAKIDVDHFEVDPGEGCLDDWGAAAQDVQIETSPDSATWTTAATPSFVAADAHRMNVVTPTAGRNGVRFVRVTINSTRIPGSEYMDLSEFAVYAPAPVSAPPTPAATVPPAPVPTATATPVPIGKPSFKLARTGKRSIRNSARCPKACRVTATLTVDAATARRLHSRRTLASIRRTLKAGSTTFTVKVSRQARFTSVRSIKATVTVRSGSVVERRRVTIRR